MKLNKSNNSAGIGAVYTASTEATVDVFQTVGHTAKSTKALAIAGNAKASLVMIEAIGETLEGFGYDVEAMKPAEVIEAWKEVQTLLEV
jgi:hypothetical protein